MAIIGNEVAAANQLRRGEELSKSPVGGLIGSGLPVAGAVVSLGTTLAAGGSTGLVLAGSIVAASGIVDWLRKLGTSKVSENLEALGEATEDAFNRVENDLKDHGISIDEIKRRLESEELKSAMASASLQAIRTTQKDRLIRLALILANGLKENDLAQESTDDMMRAAVELTDWDIFVLEKFYESQKQLLSIRNFSHDWSTNVGHVWADWCSTFGLSEDQHLKLRSAISRLVSVGFVAEAQTNFVKDGTLARQPFGLLPEGARFREHLREISKERSSSK